MTLVSDERSMSRASATLEGWWRININYMYSINIITFGSINGLPNSVDNGIVYSVCFREERSPDGEERADTSTTEHADIIDDQVRSPRHEP